MCVCVCVCVSYIHPIHISYTYFQWYPMFSVLLEETFPLLSLPRFRYQGTTGKETLDYNKHYLKNTDMKVVMFLKLTYLK